MTQETEQLPDLIPLDTLIDNLEFKFHAMHIARTEPIDQMKERASVLVYLERYRDSLKKKNRRKKKDSHHEDHEDLKNDTGNSATN